MFRNALRPSKAPNLPQPTEGVTRNYLEDLTRSLRTYFNTVDGNASAVYGDRGGQYIDCPYGLFFDTQSQSLLGANTATPVFFRQPYLSNAVRVNAGTNSRIYADVAGVYNFQFSGQLSSTNSSSKTIYVWIVRNGTDVGYSTHAYTISGSGTQLEISWNFSIDMQAGAYIELEWASDNTNVTLSAAAAASPHPGIPSAVVAVSFVAPLPQTLPTPP
jgi:hypothetical protein